jgi:hypothetical protein
VHQTSQQASSYFFPRYSIRPEILVAFLVSINYFRFRVLLLPFLTTNYFYAALVLSVAAIVLSELRERSGASAQGAPSPGATTRWPAAASAASVVFQLFIQMLMMFAFLTLYLDQVRQADSFAVTLAIVAASGIAAVVGGIRWMVYLGAGLSLLLVSGLIASVPNGVGESIVMIPSIPLSISISDSLRWISACIGAPVLSLWLWKLDSSALQLFLSHCRTNVKGSSMIVSASAAIAALLVAVSTWTNTLLVDGVSMPPHGGFSAVVVAGGVAVFAAGIAGTLWSASSLFALHVFRGGSGNVSESEAVLAGRLTATGAVVLSIGLIPISKILGSAVVSYFIILPACFCPPFVAAYLLRLFFKNGSLQAERWSLLSGEALALAAFIFFLSDSTQDVFLLSTILFIATGAVYGIASVIAAHDLAKGPAHSASSVP